MHEVNFPVTSQVDGENAGVHFPGFTLSCYGPVGFPLAPGAPLLVGGLAGGIHQFLTIGSPTGS